MYAGALCPWWLFSGRRDFNWSCAECFGNCYFPYSTKFTIIFTEYSKCMNEMAKQCGSLGIFLIQFIKLDLYMRINLKMICKQLCSRVKIRDSNFIYYSICIQDYSSLLKVLSIFVILCQSLLFYSFSHIKI